MRVVVRSSSQNRIDNIFQNLYHGLSFSLVCKMNCYFDIRWEFVKNQRQSHFYVIVEREESGRNGGPLLRNRSDNTYVHGYF